MSRSCHSATSSTPACALPRSTRASPVTCSDLIGLRLCGIALEPFWPAPNGSRTSRDLGAGQMAELGREPLEPGAGERDRLEQLGVSIARDDLRRDRLALRGRVAPAPARSKSGEVALYVPTAPDSAPTVAWAKPRSSRCALRSASNANPASLIPNVVGSAWMPWVRPTQSVWTCSRACAASAPHQTARVRQHDRRRPRRSWSASPVSSTSLEVRP